MSYETFYDSSKTLGLPWGIHLYSVISVLAWLDTRGPVVLSVREVGCHAF